MERMVHSMFGILGASLSKVAAVGLDRQRTSPRSSDMITRLGTSYKQTEPDMTDGEAVMVMHPSKYLGTMLWDGGGGTF